jgi:uncharacterized protein YbbK (DUF523 family)
MGERVRYDGQSQALPCDVLKPIEQSKQWLPICPEMAIGLGVPRPAIQLRQYATGYRAVVTENPSLDYTQALRDYAATLLQHYPDLTSFILKQKSPSCGTGNTKLFDSNGILQQEKGWGVFADELRRLNPKLLIISELLIKK